MAKEFRCKICGDTEFTELESGLLQCRSCKHKTPKPKDNADLMERANSLRFDTKDFDEAASIYEEVIRLTPDEAEAYWGRMLCRYGIEYVKDSDGTYLPTCHRTIEGSILDDADYKMALSKAADGMRGYYTTEAETIDAYQKKIKLIASREEPYDVFISFKATDERGLPTPDSLLAQELYYYLTKNLGLKVFFSNITLKDKAGQEYEPIIYAALTSATVMVLVGTKPEYINATWVKNEWSRYTKMMATAAKENKTKYIVCAIKDMRPEQLPSALSSYQAVNLGELGAKEKLCSNIDSLIGDLRVASQAKAAAAPISMENVAGDMLAQEAANLCRLGFQALETDEIDRAADYFVRATEKNASCSLAHWGRLLLTEGVSSDAELGRKTIPIHDYALFKIAYECGTPEEKARYDRVKEQCRISLERADAKTRHNNEYNSAVEELKYGYSKNHSTGECTHCGEETNKVFQKFRDAAGAYNLAHAELQKAEGKKSFSFGWVIMVLLIAIFALMPAIAAESVVGAVDDITYAASGVYISEVLPDADMLNGPSYTLENHSAEELGITPEQYDKMLISLQNFDMDEELFAESLCIIIPIFILCIVIVVAILKIFFGWLIAIIGGIIGASALTEVLAMAFLSMAVSPSVNWIILIGGLLCGVGILVMVLGIMKNIKLKSVIANWKVEENRLWSERCVAYQELLVHSGNEMRAMNQKFYNQYGDEIDEYENDYVLATEVLGASDSDVRNAFNIEQVAHKEGQATGGSGKNVKVILNNAGPRDASVVLKIKEVTGMPVTQARPLVDAAPTVLFSSLDADVADMLLLELLALDADVDIEPID